MDRLKEPSPLLSSDQLRTKPMRNLQSDGGYNRHDDSVLQHAQLTVGQEMISHRPRRQYPSNRYKMMLLRFQLQSVDNITSLGQIVQEKSHEIIDDICLVALTECVEIYGACWEPQGKPLQCNAMHWIHSPYIYRVVH